MKRAIETLDDFIKSAKLTATLDEDLKKANGETVWNITPSGVILADGKAYLEFNPSNAEKPFMSDIGGRQIHKFATIAAGAQYLWENGMEAEILKIPATDSAPPKETLPAIITEEPPFPESIKDIKKEIEKDDEEKPAKDVVAEIDESESVEEEAQADEGESFNIEGAPKSLKDFKESLVFASDIKAKLEDIKNDFKGEIPALGFYSKFGLEYGVIGLTPEQNPLESYSPLITNGKKYGSLAHAAFALWNEHVVKYIKKEKMKDVWQTNISITLPDTIDNMEKAKDYVDKLLTHLETSVSIGCIAISERPRKQRIYSKEAAKNSPLQQGSAKNFENKPEEKPATKEEDPVFAGYYCGI